MAPRGASPTLVLLGLCTVLLWLYMRQTTRPYPNTSSGYLQTQALALVCNPYDEPGHLIWNKENSRTATWATFPSSNCDEAPDYFALLKTAFDDAQPANPELAAEKTRAIEKTRFLRNQTLLLLGDSVDRNALFHLSDLMRAGVWPTGYHNASIVGVEDGWDVRGSPHVLDQWQLQFRAYNGFFYGMDDVDEFQWQIDWRPPGKAEKRIEELFVPFMKDIGTPPDFIMLHAGMWDLALWGRQDTKLGLSTADPLTPERLIWWSTRMKAVIRLVQQKWPHVPLWLRTSHRVGILPAVSSGDYTVGVEDNPHKVQNFFTDLRTHQLRELQKSVAKEMCLPLFDFGHIWEGWQDHQDKVHPDPLPGGLAYGLPLMHAMYLESIGRSKWLHKPCPVDYEP